MESTLGCDSTVYLTLTVTEGLETYLEDQTCVGADYTLNGFNIIAPEEGIVYDTLFLESTLGCDSTVYLTLTVTEGMTTYLDEQICVGNDYIANGFSIIAPEEGVILDTLFLQTAMNCDSTVYLTLTVTEGLSTYLNEKTCVGHDYTLNGFHIIAPEEGVVFDTLFLQSTQGCDSTVFLQLAVEPVLPGDTTVVTEMPFTWYGETYSLSGDYPHTLVDGSYLGCDSIVTLHLTVLPTLPGDTIAITCQPFTWYGDIYDVSGDYSHTFIGGSYYGLDSTVVLHLQVIPVLPGDTAVVTCEPILWYGQNCDSTGDYTHTFIDGSYLGCDSTVTLHLTVHQTFQTEWEHSDCGFFTWNDTTYIESGDYTQHLYSQYDCDSVVTLHLTIYPIVSYEWSDTTCEPYQWNDSLYLESGDYIQYFQTTLGCDSIVTLHLSVGHEVQTDTLTTCCNLFQWHGHTFLESGLYTDTLYTTLGCDSIVTLHLSVVNPQTEIIGYQDVFYASDLWHGIYHYYLVESTGVDLGPIEWQCDQPNWIVTQDPADDFHCMLLVKTIGTATLTAHTTTIAGCDDLLSIEINATEYIEEKEPDIHLYPNPATSEVTIVAQNMVYAKIINAYGQVVKYVQPVNNDATTISIQDLRRAIYFVEIHTPKETVIERLIITK